MRHIKFILLSLLLSSLIGCQSVDQEAFDRERAAEARLKLGLAYLAQDNPNLAYQNLTAALQHSPDNLNVLLGMAFYEQYIGEHQQAEQRYQHLLEQHPNHSLVLTYYGSFLCKRGDYQLAQQTFSASFALKQYQFMAEGLEQAAFCALENHDISYADKLFSLLFLYDPPRRQHVVATIDYYKQKNDIPVVNYLHSIIQ